MINGPIIWVPRTSPLAPCCVVAEGAPVVARLLAALASRNDASLARLRGVASADLVVVEGDADALPWADGVVYLGADRAAPGVFLPTTLSPSVPVDLLAQAVLKRCDQSGPVAILARPNATPALALVPLGGARPVTYAAVAKARENQP